jgi:hypothetical protein
VFSALKAALQLEPMPASLHPLLLEPEVHASGGGCIVRVHVRVARLLVSLVV